MRRWGQAKVVEITRQFRPRYLSTVTSSPTDVERISVKCGSAGSVYVDLHNIAKVSSSDPLLIYLPPWSTSSTAGVPQIPAFCRGYPTAVINYRWAGYPPFEGNRAPLPTADQDSDGLEAPLPLAWPVPVTDTAQAYSWIVENLTPPTYTRRDVYVYGSYLGASLATSLALTETHPHQRMAMRGFVAYNGIYNWTMFLPDHQINKQSGSRTANILEEILGQPTDPTFQELKLHAPDLFGDPSHIFDPFASPCLFFQTPGLWVPQDFDSPADPVLSMLGSAAGQADGALDAIKSLLAMMAGKPPRRSALAFPPRQSTLKIPETLLLHTSLPAPMAVFRRRPQKRRKAVVDNHFRTQAEELAGLMRRSLEKLEFKERSRWDEDFDGYDEMYKRVQVRDVGMDERSFELPSRGEALVSEWLEDRMEKRM
ncbi:hypothetical protein BJ170DRAFT_678571 [Xylariales sp. AK1849]|nr:hypothetical protein BJ170DRAFT_678571 [Xylariales sp. AK1849]